MNVAKALGDGFKVVVSASRVVIYDPVGGIATGWSRCEGDDLEDQIKGALRSCRTSYAERIAQGREVEAILDRLV